MTLIKVSEYGHLVNGFITLIKQVHSRQTFK